MALASREDGHYAGGMVASRKVVLEEALALEPEARAQLANELLSEPSESEERDLVAHALLASLDGEEGTDGSSMEPSIAQAWAEEITRRASDVRAGRAELVDGPTSLRAIRARLQRS
jgi:Putative addiction module component